MADRVLNRPLLITRDKAQVVLSVLAGRIGVNSPEASRFEGSNFVIDENGRAKERPYKVSNGVAIITITGSLVNRGAWVGASSGLTSYEGIRHQLNAAENDSAVHSVILDMHTPGGEAVGTFETAERVRQLASKKRVIGVVNGMAASAGYAIASGASEIVTTETGVSGSIGVVLLHADFSRQLDREGIKPSLIHAGAHKVDGNPFEPLSEDVRADLQAEVNAFYESFLQTVSKGRGARLSIDAARATEARTLIGKEAVKAGLADRVGTFETVLADLTRATPRVNFKSRGSAMDNNYNPTPVASISQAQHDSAVASAHAIGFRLGESATLTKIQTVVSAKGIAGNPARMSNGIDLVAKQPAMSTADVITSVCGHAAGSVQATRTGRLTTLAVKLAAEKPGLDGAEGVSQPKNTGGRLTSLAARLHAGRNAGTE
ncbi:peptidase S46 [Ochrobactrum sp. P6BS-III]|nr:peptidase S46 [Ochrobactrum sp. P6BS-III]